MKRIFSFLSVIVFSFIMLSACGGNDLDKEISYDIIKDLEGIDFVIWQGSAISNVFMYKENTTLADDALERIDYIEQVFNCDVIIEMGGDDAELNKKVLALMAVGDGSCDAFVARSHLLRPIGNAQGLVPMEDVEHIMDFHDRQKWGELNAQELMMCKGTLYGLIPVAWPDMFPEVYYMLITNNEIIKNHGGIDPREYIETKTWNRDTFEKSIQDYTYLGASENETIYGISAAPMHLVRMALLGNGVEYVVSNGEGSYKSGFDTDEAIEGLTWLQNLLKNNKECFVLGGKNGDDVWSSFSTPFKESRASMYLTNSRIFFNEVTFEIKDFAVLPFPTGPSGEYGKWPAAYESTQAVAIPIFAEDIDVSAMVLDEMFKPLNKYPDYESLMSRYKNQVFDDQRDIDMMMSIGNNARYSYWIEGGDGALWNISNNYLNGSPANLIKSHIGTMKKTIDEAILPNDQNMDRYR